MINNNEFSLKDNSSIPFGWMVENVDLNDIDDAEAYVSDYAQTMINAENYSDISDAEMFEVWKTESGEFEEAVAFVQSKMVEYGS